MIADDGNNSKQATATVSTPTARIQPTWCEPLDIFKLQTPSPYTNVTQTHRYTTPTVFLDTSLTLCPSMPSNLDWRDWEQHRSAFSRTSDLPSCTGHICSGLWNQVWPHLVCTRRMNQTIPQSANTKLTDYNRELTATLTCRVVAQPAATLTQSSAGTVSTSLTLLERDSDFNNRWCSFTALWTSALLDCTYTVIYIHNGHDAKVQSAIWI